MKNTLFLATLVFASSCCNSIKYDCDFKLGAEVAFKGYSSDDLDTVIVKTYKAGTNMTILLDSARRGFFNNSMVVTKLSDGVVDYRLEIPATHQSVTLTNPEYVSKACGNCKSLLDRKEGVKTLELASIEINGVRTEHTIYELTKP